MWLFGDSDASRRRNDALAFTLGAAGGFLLGLLLSRGLGGPRRLGDELRARAGSAVRRLRPARLHRLVGEQEELDRLENAVLDAFLADSILGERPVDIGAISPGIVELSGFVWSAEEVQRAAGLASGVPGVRTVVNRLDVGEPGQRRAGRPLDDDDRRSTFSHLEARVGGMGRRRQNPATDPDRPDDSQKIGERALAEADRDQWEEEIAMRRPGMAVRAGERPPSSGAYDEEELDNQDPHGKHAELTLDEPPERLHAESRVGEGEKPGTEVRLEKSELEEESHRESGAGKGGVSEPE